MAVTLPDELKTILDGPNFAHLTTLDADGTPQSTAMWVTRDGDHVVFNTAQGRRKWRNLSNDPRVSVSICPADQPYRNFSIVGRVIEMRTSDGKEVIDGLSEKYTGNPEYQHMTPGMVRVTVIVEPTRIASWWIEVWADYICPWCYLALDRVAHLEHVHEVEVVWRPYELHPEIPPEGAPVARRLISSDARTELRTELDEAGLAVTRRTTMSNSARALALSAWAAPHPAWPMLHRSLYEAYWSQGRDLGDPDVLVGVAAASGIDADDAREAVAAGLGRDEVAVQRDRALDLGIGGTPGWHFGDGVVLVGAHPRNILDRVVSRHLPPTGHPHL